MLGSIRGISDWCCKDCKMIYRLWKQRILKQNISDGDWSLQWQLDLEANHQIIEIQ